MDDAQKRTWGWSPRQQRWLLAGSTGVTLGFSVPGFGLPLLGLVALAPLLILYEKILSLCSSKRKAFALLLGYSWVAGCVCAAIGGYSITNSAHVYGHLPLPLAILITAFGYGLEVGLIFFCYFALPLMVLPRHAWADLPLRLCWMLWLEPLYPRLFDWTLGGWAFYQIPWVEQTADLIGASGLSGLSVGCNMTLLLAWRSWNSANEIPRTLALRGILLWLGGLSLASVYGVFRQEALWKVEPTSQLQVIALQPNFSLQELASNPELAYSDRGRNLESLLSDSRLGLAAAPRGEVPRLLIWPESTFPAPILKDDSVRQRVAAFAQEEQTYVLLSSVDWEMQADRSYRFFGISVLLNPQGQIAGRYNKIFLIPFGESIPGATWFPSWAEWLRQQIPNISEFEAGTEHTVMSVGSARLAAPICFDGFSPEIIRNMARNGAEVVVLSANLAWFGRSNATDHLEMVSRWHSLENRVPLLLVSNSGESVFWDATGAFTSDRLELFEQGNLHAVLNLATYDSWYRKHAEWMPWSFAGLGLLWSGIWWGWLRRPFGFNRGDAAESGDESAHHRPGWCRRS